MKKHFDVFKRLKEKKVYTPKTKKLEDILPDSIKKRDFRYFPPNAFKKLTIFKEYSHLKKGLYVDQKKLHVDETVKIACPSKHINYHSDGDMLTMLSWFHAKTTAREFCAKLMTPSEWFCVVEWLENSVALSANKSQSQGDKNMLEDITIHDEEWLDAMVRRTEIGKQKQPWKPKKIKVRAYINSHVNGEKSSGGFKYKIPIMDMGFFNSDDINYRKGIPNSTSMNGNMYYHEELYPDRAVFPFDKAASRSFITRSKEWVVPCLNLFNYANMKGSKRGLRLCYEPDVFEIMSGGKR